MAEEKEGEIGSEAAGDTKRDWTYENKLTQGFLSPHTGEVMQIGFYFQSRAYNYKNNPYCKTINYFSDKTMGDKDKN